MELPDQDFSRRSLIYLWGWLSSEEEESFREHDIFRLTLKFKQIYFQID
jgi:hypothetical protein